MIFKKYKLQILATCFMCVFAIACTTVLITGRRQVTGIISSDEIIKMSADAYRQVLDSVKLSSDQEKVALVKRAGNRIKEATEQYLTENEGLELLEGFEWEFNLVDNDTLVNAWAMPGGKVAFYTAILPICKDETGLAVVMGHEVANAIAKHGQERMNQELLKNGSLTLGALTLGGGNGGPVDYILSGSGALGQLAFSRKHESEADELGLYFMAMAGYDPTVAPSFWERMSGGSSGQRPPEFMSTHPSHETRIKRLNDAMPKALAYYKER